MTAQAGAVAWRWLWADGSRASEWFDGFPTEATVRNGAEKGAHVEYLTPPAAVPVEALEGLVAELRNEAATIAKPYGFVTDHILGKAEGLESCAERIERLIKERSNG